MFSARLFRLVLLNPLRLCSESLITTSPLLLGSILHSMMHHKRGLQRAHSWPIVWMWRRRRHEWILLLPWYLRPSLRPKEYVQSLLLPLLIRSWPSVLLLLLLKVLWSIKRSISLVESWQCGLVSLSALDVSSISSLIWGNLLPFRITHQKFGIVWAICLWMALLKYMLLLLDELLLMLSSNCT